MLLFQLCFSYTMLIIESLCAHIETSYANYGHLKQKKIFFKLSSAVSFLSLPFYSLNAFVLLYQLFRKTLLPDIALNKKILKGAHIWTVLFFFNFRTILSIFVLLFQN